MAEPRYDVLALRPTQFSAGLACAHTKSRETAMMWAKGPEQFDQFLRKNKVVVVRGPTEEGKEAVYIVDHHHLVLAIHLEKSIPESAKRVYVEELPESEELSRLPLDRFWPAMVERNFAYLFHHGVARPASALARDVRGLLDDPYRTLAWAARKLLPESEHGYRKTEVPFSEFRWAEYLRASPDFQRDLAALGRTPDLEGAETQPDVIRAAARACRLPAAQHLPGYIAPHDASLLQRAGVTAAAALAILTLFKLVRTLRG